MDDVLNTLLDKYGQVEISLTLHDISGETKQLIFNNHQLIDLNLTIKLNKPDQSLKVLFDKERIGQVITNLLSNAIKFSSEGSKIIATIRLTDKNEVLFSIQDQGIGIPSNELEAIFSTFIQSSSTKTGAGGTGLGLGAWGLGLGAWGLGLAISKQLIEVHGGKIWAELPSKKGATFSFILPNQIDDKIYK